MYCIFSFQCFSQHSLTPPPTPTPHPHTHPHLPDGRWANTPCPPITPDFLTEHGVSLDATFFPDDQLLWLETSPYHITSPYGLLRSPWDFNPVNYTVRYDNVFRIDDLSSFVESSNDVVTRNNNNDDETSPSISTSSTSSLTYHLGVTCKEYQTFFDKVRGQPLHIYLSLVEKETLSMAKSTFAGVGGDRGYDMIQQLMDNYGFTLPIVLTTTASAHPFFTHYLRRNPTATYHLTTPFTTTIQGEEGETSQSQNNIVPISCSIPDPSSLLQPPQCDFHPYFYDSEETVNELIELFYPPETDPSEAARTHLYR